MFRLGMGEIFLIVITVFLLLSPKDFLKFIKSMGKYYRQFLNVKDSLTKMADIELNKIETTEKPSGDSSDNK